MKLSRESRSAAPTVGSMAGSLGHTRRPRAGNHFSYASVSSSVNGDRITNGPQLRRFLSKAGKNPGRVGIRYGGQTGPASQREALPIASLGSVSLWSWPHGGSHWTWEDRRRTAEPEDSGSFLFIGSLQQWMSGLGTAAPGESTVDL